MLVSRQTETPVMNSYILQMKRPSSSYKSSVSQVSVLSFEIGGPICYCVSNRICCARSLSEHSKRQCAGVPCRSLGQFKTRSGKDTWQVNPPRQMKNLMEEAKTMGSKVAPVATPLLTSRSRGRQKALRRFAVSFCGGAS